MAWDDVWERVFTSQEWGKYPGEDVIRFIARNFYQLEDRRSVKILEIGSGPGANLWFLAREGFDVYAIEGSLSGVEQAKARLDKELPGWRGEVLCGDFSSLPYDSETFDAVIDVEAVTCNPFAESVAIYKEVHRVLKPGGKLYSRTFAKGTLGDETGEKISHNCYLTDTGPMAGKGPTRFTADDEIAQLLAPFSSFSFGELARSEDQVLITKEWCMTAVK